MVEGVTELTLRALPGLAQRQAAEIPASHLYTRSNAPDDASRMTDGSPRPVALHALRRHASPGPTTMSSTLWTAGPLTFRSRRPYRPSMQLGKRQIVAFGGGGFSMEAGNPLLDDYVLGLTGVPRPRLCFLPSASGDADHYIVRFYRHFAGRAETSHVSLFRRDHDLEDLHTHLLSQDAIYVGGGSVVSLMGVWRAHGIDSVLREAWESGVLLCGVSAGSLCWFADGISAFHGTPQRYQGLGLLPWSNTVHYDADRSRGDAFREHLMQDMPPGYAACDGTALHFVGERLASVVSSRPGAKAYRMACVNGKVRKRSLDVRYLGDDSGGVRLPALPAPARLTVARTSAATG
jgi:dipeptidase E